jgi:hypothetical protein
VQGESGAVSKAGVGKLANLGVTLQRRWANVLSDATRQVMQLVKLILLLSWQSYASGLASSKRSLKNKYCISVLHLDCMLLGGQHEMR